MNVLEQEKIDKLMLDMDGTENKCKMLFNMGGKKLFFERTLSTEQQMELFLKPYLNRFLLRCCNILSDIYFVGFTKGKKS